MSNQHSTRATVGSMELLLRMSSHRADSPAVHTVRAGTSTILTYGKLLQRVGALAAAIDQDCPARAVIALSLPSSADFIIAYLAILSAGRVVHPVPQNSSPAELSGFLKTTGADTLIGDRACLDAAGKPCRLTKDAAAMPRESPAAWSNPPVPAQTPGLYLPSSGTTGMPKIAVRSRASLDAVAKNVAQAAGWTPDDRVLAAVPMSHSYGMENGLLGPIWAGSCIHVVDRNGREGGSDVGELLSELTTERITAFPAVPFMIDVLAKLSPISGTRTSLKQVYTAGSPLPEAVAAAFKERFGLGVGQLYGATELGSVTFAPPGLAGSCVGFPMPGVNIRILDTHGRAVAFGVEGQVAIRADSMLTCYLGEDRSAIVDGHFLTGDLGRLEPDGSLIITGRLKLLIDVGGFKVNPIEVEQILCRHPSIGEAVVVPIAVTQTVSRLKAVVTPAHPGHAVSVEDVRAFVRSVLATHKVPRIVEVVERLPKSPTGKILRRQLESGS